MRYSVTTREPGASEVLTCFFDASPRSTAFFASSPAASSTPGFEVFVHEVIAAISTSPLPIRMSPLPVGKRGMSVAGALPYPPSATDFENSSWNFALTLPISMRSCGRFGPASDGATVPRSSSTTWL